MLWLSVKQCAAAASGFCDLREPRRALATSLRELRRARRLVISDPEILGGDPVFRGTRVPVHMIAGLLAQGSTLAEVIEGYTRLAAEMIRSRRSTPPPIRCVAGPDGSRRDRQPLRRSRRKLNTISVS